LTIAHSLVEWICFPERRCQ
jgi:galactonate dehydratase